MIACVDGNGDIDTGPILFCADVGMVAGVRINRCPAAGVRTIRAMVMPGGLDCHMSVAANAQNRRLRHVEHRQRREYEYAYPLAISHGRQNHPLILTNPLSVRLPSGSNP